MSMQETVYSETIRVSLADQTMQDVSKFQKQLDTLQKSIEQINRLKLAVSLGQTQQQLNGVARSVQQVAQPHTIKLNLVDHVTSGLKSISNRLASLTNKAISIPIKAVMNPVVDALAAGGAAMGAGASIKLASDWQAAQVQFQANTGVTSQQLAPVAQTVQSMALQTGGNRNDLLDAAMHIYDITGSLTDLPSILSQAARSAISTGGNVTDAAQILANTLHEAGLDKGANVGANADQIMGLVHRAAQLGNLTMPDLAANSGQAMGIGLNIGASPSDVVSMIVDLTKHGFPQVADAQTQVKDLLTHGINPTTSSMAELTRLSQSSGINVAQDFSARGFATKGVMGVLDELRSVYDKLGYTDDQRTASAMRVVNAQRGGLGLAAMMGTGWSDLQMLTGTLGDKSANAGVTDTAWTAWQQTAQFQMDRFKQGLETLGTTVGNVVLPHVTDFLSTLNDKLPSIVDHATQVLAPFSDGLQKLLGGDQKGAMSSFAQGFQNIWTAAKPYIDTLWTQVVNTVQAAMPMVLDAWSKLQTAIGNWIQTTGVPYIRSVLVQWGAEFWNWIPTAVPPMLGALGGLLTQLVAWSFTVPAQLAIGFAQWNLEFWKWVPGAVPPMLDKLGDLAGQLLGWIRDQVPGIAGQLAQWAGEFWRWVTDMVTSIPGHFDDLTAAIKRWSSSNGQAAMLEVGKSLGQSLIQGLWNFITQTIPSAAGQAWQALGGAANYVGSNFAGGYAGSLGLPQAGTGPVHPYALGGWITEPVMGVGLSTGKLYSFGERGAEFVSPSGRGAGGSVTLHVGAISIDARGAADGVEGKIRQGVQEGLRQFVDDVMQGHRTMSTAAGAS